MGNTEQKPQNPNQDEEHKEEEQEEIFTCEICIEPTNNRFKNSNRCFHPFCTDCIMKYIQVKLEDYNISDIKCPATTCNHSLEPLSCKITHRQLFVKWCDALCESFVLKDDRVYCPNIECSELILNECGVRSLKKCVCPYCKKPFCFQCKVAWHAGYSCKETGEMRDENDVAFGILYEIKEWKRCPRCTLCLEHFDGCFTVTCRCGFKFCYICVKQWCRCRVERRILWWLLLLPFIIVIIIYMFPHKSV